MPPPLFCSGLRRLIGAVRPFNRAATSIIDRERTHLIGATRRRWARDSRVHIDTCPQIRSDVGGTWISAWLLAGDLAPIDADALSAAVRNLPLWPGEVYRLLRQEGLTYAEIAERLGITVDQVQNYVADALAYLDAALGND